MKLNSSLIKFSYRVILFAMMTMLLTFYNYEINAQGPVTAAVEGKVLDSLTGKSIEGVSVRLVSSESNFESTVFTDKNGRFYKGELPPGIYTILFSAEGYQSTHRVQALELLATKTTIILPDPLLERVKIL